MHRRRTVIAALACGSALVALATACDTVIDVKSSISTPSTLFPPTTESLFAGPATASITTVPGAPSALPTTPAQAATAPTAPTPGAPVGTPPPATAPPGTPPATVAAPLTAPATTTAPALAVWGFNGQVWQIPISPPACPNPLQFPAPTDVTSATSILYPGQVRGGNYKTHGGFRFDGVANTAVTVTLPMAGSVIRAARYIEGGEIQYLFDVVAQCGVLFRFDHLLLLSPEFAAIADTLPAAMANDSRTWVLPRPVPFAAGVTVANGVGFAKTANTTFDFGVYDLRQHNAVGANPIYVSTYGAELAPYGVCWLDLLSATASATVRALPAGDATAGTTSDYCH